jgi:hypothetical protein
MELESLSTAPAHEAGAECRIKVNGKDTDVYISVKGEDSQAYRKAKKRQMRTFVEARGKDIDIDTLDTDAMDVELLVDCTVGWRGITKEGKEFKFTEANAKKLYSNAPDIVLQLLRFIEKRGNFTGG